MMICIEKWPIILQFEVMAEMMWDPTLDPDVLITEFLDGYSELQYKCQRFAWIFDW